MFAQIQNTMFAQAVFASHPRISALDLASSAAGLWQIHDADNDDYDADDAADNFDDGNDDESKDGGNDMDDEDKEAFYCSIKRGTGSDI